MSGPRIWTQVARNTEDMLYPELSFFSQYLNESFAGPKYINP